MPRARGLSSRPKKKARLEPTETEGPESAEIICNEDGQLDAVEPEEEPEGEGPHLGSPGAVRRAAAAEMHNEAIEHAAVWRFQSRHYL